MKVGDILKINGFFGFLEDPTLRVVEIKGTLAKVVPVDAKEGGLLSELNETWHSIELLNKKLTTLKE
jgi:hypothetical protein